MASRTMHLAIAKEIEGHNPINNIYRYEIGQILPDAITHSLSNHADSHFKSTVCDGRMKMIDFAKFRSDFQDEIATDDLYLGYYFHLIQDGIYRRFLYYDYGYKVTCPEDVELLHNDYHLLNTYLVSKYHLQNSFSKPEGFEKEKINHVYPFSFDAYLEDLKNDFLPYRSGKTVFFTESMADEYISSCSELCNREFESVQSERTCVNPMDFAWKLPIKIND